MESEPWILIVEDDDDDLRLIDRARRQVAPRIGSRAVRSVAEAKAVLRHSRPSLLILDIVLEDTNGLVLLDYLFDLPAFATLPVICFSGYDDDEVVAEARSLGADSFVAKSADYNHCLVELERALVPWLGAGVTR